MSLFINKLAGSASVNAPISNQHQTPSFGAYQSENHFSDPINKSAATSPIDRRVSNPIGKPAVASPIERKVSNPIAKPETANPLEGFDSSVLAKYDGRDRSPNSADALHGTRLYELV